MSEKVVQAAKRFVSIADDMEHGCASWHMMLESAYQILKKSIEAEEERRKSEYESEIG